MNTLMQESRYVPIPISAAALVNCRAAATALLGSDDSILVVSISTMDGFDVAHVRRDGLPDPTRLPAITSSLAALGAAVSSELMIGEFENVIIESTNGRTLMMHARGTSKSLILAVVTSKKALLGKILVVTRECSQGLVHVLDADV